MVTASGKQECRNGCGRLQAMAVGVGNLVAAYVGPGHGPLWLCVIPISCFIASAAVAPAGARLLRFQIRLVHVLTLHDGIARL